MPTILPSKGRHRHFDHFTEDPDEGRPAGPFGTLPPDLCDHSDF